MRKRFVFLFLILAVLSFVSISCGTRSAEPARVGSGVGDKATDFSLKTLDGKEVRLSSFLGKRVVLLDFGATWCPHCVNAVPKLRTVSRDYRDKGLEVISIDIREPKDTVESFVKKHDISYTVLLDLNGSVATSYAVVGIPTVIIVGKDGIIRYRGHGFSESLIDKVIAR